MTLPASVARRGLNGLLALNALAAGAAAVVLVFAPAAIPAFAGIALDPSQYLLAYLLGAAELALAALAALALGTRVMEVRRVAVVVLILLHAASAVAGLVAVAQGHSLVVSLNVLARVLMIVALALCWRGSVRGAR